MAGFNPLALLMGQQIAAGALPPEEEENIITVTAPQGRPEGVMPNYGDAPERPRIDPNYVLNDDRIAPSEEELREILPRRGMFGVKGTLRDILGTLGDAFLVQSGNKEIYAPQRERERMGDAMFGASQNPRQAAERLAAGGFADQSRQLLEQVSTDEYRSAQQASLEGTRQDQAANRREDNLTVLRNLTARRLQAAGDRPDAVQYAIQLAMQDAQRLGISMADLGIQPGMTPEQMDVVAGGDMTVNQQVQVPFTERRVATGEYNAQTGRINANRPRNPPPRPRADTELEYYRAVSEIPENDRTPEERSFMRRYIEGTGGRGGSGRSAPPPPATTTGRQFRVLNRN
jgi:hypothetical protein